MLLLVASVLFYMAFVPVYVLILVYTILVDYIAGLWIEKSEGTRRKLALLASLVANISVLAVFKYYNFFRANISAVYPASALPVLDLVLPIGLSFHTFQAMSYTIEVYRRKLPAEKHLGIYALYVMFYPQLVAGPIERPQNLLHQLKEKHSPQYENFTNGLKLMLWGFFQKIVIADRLAVFVNHVYGEPAIHSPLVLLLATYAFAFQIYCDFAGYTDIAIGAAQVMGIDLMKNFNRPYFAVGIQDFWRRWHISLSTWFKDYLYIPLGGSKNGRSSQLLNLLIVFLVSGLWHGAAWTFVIWGALHWLYLAGEHLIDWCTGRFSGTQVTVKHNKSAAFGLNLAKVVITFNLVSFAWIFFRASSLDNALTISKRVLVGTGPSLASLCCGQQLWRVMPDLNNLGVPDLEIVLMVLAVAILLGVHSIQDKFSLRAYPKKFPLAIRWGVYYGTLMLIFMFGKFSDQPFIYFQF
jgi:alginate O-acetyltransferase complex protein AlgI